MELYEVFQQLVLKPHNAMPVLNEDGLGDAIHAVNKAAIRAFARDKPDLPPQMFKETVFEFDGRWSPGPDKKKWTDEEKSFVNSIEVMVTNVFENPDYAIFGIKEKKNISWNSAEYSRFIG